MSRKPIDQQQPSECRQALWDEIRRQAEHGAFSCIEVAGATRLHLSSVKEYITGLCNAGHLVKVDRPMPESHKSQYYRLEKDAGHHAPRVRKDGSEVTQGRSRQYMWNVIPLLKSFTFLDLAYNASIAEHEVKEADASSYITHLYKAGYLVHAKTCKSGEKQLWKLRHGMWTGPKPPQIQRTKQVYDPNLQRVVWAQITGGAE